MSRLLKDSAMTFVAETGTVAFNFLAGVLTARALGPDGRGIYALVFSFASIAVLVLGIRWERPTGYFLGKDTANLPTVLTTNLLIPFYVPLVTLLIWFLYPPLLEKGLLKGATPTILWLALGLTVIMGFWSAITSVHAGLREFGLRSKFLVVWNICLMLPVLILFVAGVRDQPDAPPPSSALPWYIIGHIAVFALVVVPWMWFWFGRRKWRFGFSFPLYRGMVSYSMLTFASLLLNMASFRLDMFILNFLTNEESTGLYSIALALTNQLLVLPTVTATVLFSHTSANQTGDGEATARVLRVTLIATLAAGLVLAILAPLIVGPLYGSEYLPIIQPMWVLIPSTVCLGLFRLMTAEFDGRGMAHWTSICSLLSAVVVITLDFLWIPRFGLMGLACASLTAQALALLAASLVFWHVAGLSPARALIPRAADFGLILDFVHRMLARLRGGNRPTGGAA
ncbi:MAG: lipopolysaccharide biosynthesis protein [Phycisphaerae bacterium]